MLDLTGKAARLKETHISAKDYQALVSKYGFGVAPITPKKTKVAVEKTEEPIVVETQTETKAV